MASGKCGSSVGYASVTSVTVKVMGSEKDRAYAEIAGMMKSGGEIPGVQYRRVPGGVGWQIRTVDSNALIDYVISRGYTVPSRSPKQEFGVVREPNMKLAPDVERPKKFKEPERDHYFDPDPKLMLTSPDKSFPLTEAKEDDDAGLVKLLGCLGGTGGLFRPRQELSENYHLTTKEIGLIAAKGALVYGVGYGMGYGVQDILKGLAESPRIGRAMEKAGEKVWERLVTSPSAGILVDNIVTSVFSEIMPLVIMSDARDFNLG